MARSLSVKIPTATLIAQVEQKIADLKTEIANYPAAVKQYEVDFANYKKNLIASAIKALTENPQFIGENYDSFITLSFNDYANGGVQVRFNGDALGFPIAPSRPSNPNERKYFGREWTTTLDILEKNIKVLKMTSQEEVSASTYSSVMDLL